MRRAQTIVKSTMCTPIVPADDSNGHRSYKLLEVVQPPEIDSQRCRNISRIPIPLRDKRLIMWELMRRSFAPIQYGNSSSYIVYFHIFISFQLIFYFRQLALVFAWLLGLSIPITESKPIVSLLALLRIVYSKDCNDRRRFAMGISLATLLSV